MAGSINGSDHFGKISPTVDSCLTGNSGQYIYFGKCTGGAPTGVTNITQHNAIFNQTDGATGSAQLWVNVGSIATPSFASLNVGGMQSFVPTAVNVTGTLTPAQVQSGYITSTSAAAVTMTLPTGTLLGAAIGATQGTTMDLYIDNTAGANTVTIAVATNGILSAAAVAGTGAGFGLLTIPSGVTGQARFTLMFSSATAYTFSRTA